VYSEVRKAIPRGMHGDHLWLHIKSEVQIHCVEKDGRIFAQPNYFFGMVEVSGLYVHPRTGLLCNKPRTTNKARSKTPAKVSHVKINENEEFRNINGIWFYRKFVTVGFTQPPERELVVKKQLNRRELQDLRKKHPEVAGE
jgi:hypothetical protein